AGEAEDGALGGAVQRGGRADTRRVWLHRGVSRVPLLPRREDPHDRRGHRRGTANGDRPRARRLARLEYYQRDLPLGAPPVFFIAAVDGDRELPQAGGL